MASLDRLEGDGIEGAGWLILFLIIGIVIVVYMGVKNISLPAWAYPDTAWGNAASWIDGLFYNSPIKGGHIEQSFDKFMGAGYEWIGENLPRTPVSKLPIGDGETNMDAGTDTGSDAGYPTPDKPEV
jgi:hypothetical protein